MQRVISIWEDDREKALEYATNLTKGVSESELIQRNESEANFNSDEIAQVVDAWMKERLTIQKEVRIELEIPLTK